jgi:hypothetical protein
MCRKRFADVDDFTISISLGPPYVFSFRCYECENAAEDV